MFIYRSKLFNYEYIDVHVYYKMIHNGGCVYISNTRCP